MSDQKNAKGDATGEPLQLDSIDIYIILKDCLEHQNYERKTRIPDEEFLEKKTQEILAIFTSGIEKASVAARHDELKKLAKTVVYNQHTGVYLKDRLAQLNKEVTE